MVLLILGNPRIASEAKPLQEAGGMVHLSWCRQQRIVPVMLFVGSLKEHPIIDPKKTIDYSPYYGDSQNSTPSLGPYYGDLQNGTPGLCSAEGSHGVSNFIAEGVRPEGTWNACDNTCTAPVPMCPYIT